MERLALPRRRALTAALLLLLLVPLAPVQAASAKRVVVTGQIRYADGTPAARQHVELERITGFGDAFAALFFFGLTGGLAGLLCFEEEASDALVACGNNAAAIRTDSDGRYRFEMSADAIDTPDRKFSLTARIPRSGKRAAGAQVQVRTHLEPGTNRLPVLTLWEPRVTGPVEDLTWTPVPGDPSASYSQLFTARNGFSVETADRAFDARLLEDTRGTLQLRAQGHRGRLGATWTSPVRRYAGTAGAPVSRRAACTSTIERRATRVQQAPCWLTDARFATTYQGPRPRHCFKDPAFGDPFFGTAPTCEYATVRVVEIDLRRVVSVDAVVLRGECDDCRVVSSVDRVQWDQPRQGAVPGLVVDWEGQEARWIRVLTPSDSFRGRLQHEAPGAKLGGRDLPDTAPGDASGLTEVSVWEAAPPPPVDAPTDVDPDTPQAVRPRAEPESPGVSTAAVALAVLLLMTVSAGVVAATVTRS